MTPIETLRRRFRARLAVGLSLARASRFVLELEPFRSAAPDPFVEAAAALKAWRAALQREDVEGALDAVERTWPLLEACRQRVIARDAAIEAYRVRWACENAPLHHRTIDSLARFYRLLPISTSSQSKYEYVLTRRLAGPIGPERRIAPTGELVDAVVALETTWGAPPVVVEESEVAMVTLALKSFAREAAAQADAASFTSSAVLRRFGAFKASIGAQLFDPRLSAAVVETNVAVLNSLNQLLADAGGQPLRGAGLTKAAKKVEMPLPLPRASVVAAPEPVKDAVLPPLPEAGGAMPEAAPAPPPVPAPPLVADADAAAVRRRDRPQLLTGEIDLSGLEFVRPARKSEAPKSESEAPPAPTATEGLETPPAPMTLSSSASDASSGSSATEAANRVLEEEGAPAESPGGEEEESAPPPLVDVEQQPSVRAFELGKIEGNAAIVERYLTEPRSPEVWQLDLDVFLGQTSASGALANYAVERRRALELILAADDLICARALQDDAPTAEHRAQVRSVANAMLLLRTTLRRATDLAQGDATEREPLLYVADHLLWERLRLEASLKRRPGRNRPAALPRTSQPAPVLPGPAARARASRPVIVGGLAAAAVFLAVIGAGAFSITLPAVDPDVRVVEIAGMPGADLFDDARIFRNTLFASAGRTWVLLGKDERRTIVRGLAAFAAERGLDSVSVIGPRGEPWATFKDDEVLLEGDLTLSEMSAR